MIISIGLLAVGVVLFLVLYFLERLLGVIFSEQVPKELVITYRLFYSVPVCAVLFSVYKIIKYLLF